MVLQKVISGNITATISDHLPQFLFASNIPSNMPCQNSDIYEKYWPKSVQQNFLLECFNYNYSDSFQQDQISLYFPIE